ncbi:MAG: hypothetical protein JJ992_05915, partial [Planctomycetes bacterium]|nr:hypothetical protein [Planctomycetota bacterium]
MEIGTTPISSTEAASLLVQAVDTANIQSNITTSSLTDLTEYDFVRSKIGLNRDTQAYIGGESAQTVVSNTGGSEAGLVKVSAQNLGDISSEVYSDFLEYEATNFALENLVAFVENVDLTAAGLDVSASNSSTYVTTAEENSNSVRGAARAYVADSTVTAGNTGVTLTAVDSTSYTATSEGSGGRMALNDITYDVAAYVSGSTVDSSGPVDISADKQATLDATATLSASSSILSTANIFALNVLNGDVDAYADSSQLTTTNGGDISVQAANESTINAKVEGDATAESDTELNPGTLTFGASLAFNAMGLNSANVLLATLGDFLGDFVTEWIETVLPIAQSSPVDVRAYLYDTVADAAGNLSIEANSAPQINATVSTAAESTASSVYGAIGGTGGAVLASNKIISTATASIDYSSTFSHSVSGDDVSAGGTISVSGLDNAGIYANSKVAATSVTTNDGGASLIADAVNNAIATDFQSDDGTVDIEFGDRVLLADDFAEEDFSSDDGSTPLTAGDLVRLSDDYATPTFTTLSGVRLLRSGDVVQLADDYQNALGTPGGLYRFVGTGSRGLRVDLSVENYTDTDRWQPIGGTNESVYEYTGPDATRDLTAQDYSDPNLWREIVGEAGDIYQYMGQDTTGFDLAQADFGDVTMWNIDTTTQLVPQGHSLSSSDSLAIGAIIVFNQVDSAVEAFIHDATVTATDAIEVEAVESAVIRAVTDSLSSSSGGNVLGDGVSLAINATVATNVVLSSADAYVEASDLATTNTADGHVGVFAQNISQIDATTKAAATSGANTAAFLLAFNTVGWEAQDLFSNTLDALLGMTALGTEQPARVAAYMLDTPVDATGNVSVTADSSAQIFALVNNDATSFPAAFFGAAGMSASGILSSNMVSSSAKAYVEYSDTYVSAPVDLETDGGISITAMDDAAIDAQTQMYAEVSPTNDAGSGLFNNLASTLEDDYQYTNASGTQDLEYGDNVLVTDDYFTGASGVTVFDVDGSEDLETVAAGDLVRLTDDYSGDGGEAGGLYKFIGTAASGAINLGIEDFTDTARWLRVGGTYQYMGTSTSGAATDLGAEDYTNFGYWKRLNPANL